MTGSSAPDRPQVPRRLVTPTAHPSIGRVAGLAGHALGFRYASIVTVGRSAQVLTVHGPATGSAEDTTIRMAETVALAGHLVVAADLSKARAAAVRRAAGRATGAYLGAPIVGRDGSVVAVLGLAHPEARPIAAGDIRLAAEFALLAADLLLGDTQAPADDAAIEIAQAVASGQIVPWYQPILDLETRQWVKFEALARWQRPDGTIGDPVSFIPLAEQSDLILRLDLAVATRAITDLGRWLVDRPYLRMSVNLSGRHLDKAGAVADIRRICELTGVGAEHVDLELTETARPSDTDTGAATMLALRQLGYKLWFDDFGTGWSELHDLLQLPVDGIKIDRTFARTLGSSTDDAVVRAMTAAAEALKLGVTIEGIETEDQAVRALELGCHFAQGFLWAKPMPAEQVDAVFLSGSDRPPTP